MAKSAPAAHRLFTQLPNNRPHVLLSLDVKYCTERNKLKFCEFGPGEEVMLEVMPEVMSAETALI